MTDSIIHVSNLGKKYLISPQKADRYGSFRETITRGAVTLGRRLCNRMSVSVSQPTIKSEAFWALQNVGFEIKRGEVIGIIGRNGAGKSTLLKILSRITEPTTGSVKINGRVASLLEVGTGFHPELTGRENIFLNGAILGMRRAEIIKKFDEIVAFAEVEKFLNTPVKRYSSGMYVRLAFAVAAHLEPEILLIDEVLAVGDAQFQNKCLGKMGDVAKEGRTVMFVSHNMAVIQKLCPRALLLKNGTITMDGNVQNVVTNYIDEVYQAEPSINVDLIDMPRRPGFGEQIRISDCKIFNSSNNESEQLKFGEQFTVELESKSTMAVNNISFVLGIESLLGVRILTSMSEEAGHYFSLKSGKRVRVRLSIENLMLKPGKYFLTVGIRSNKIGLDQIINAKAFHVTSFLKDHNVMPMDVWGMVHIMPKWSKV